MLINVMAVFNECCQARKIKFRSSLNVIESEIPADFNESVLPRLFTFKGQNLLIL
jgi:hypothetical protein